MHSQIILSLVPTFEEITPTMGGNKKVSCKICTKIMRSDNLKRHYKKKHTESNQTVVPEKTEPKKTEPKKEERTESNQSETPKSTVPVRVCGCPLCENEMRSMAMMLLIHQIFRR